MIIKNSFTKQLNTYIKFKLIIFVVLSLLIGCGTDTTVTDGNQTQLATATGVAVDELLIVIAQFDTGTDSVETEVHNKIYQAIKGTIDIQKAPIDISGVRVEIDSGVLEANNRIEAEMLGNQYNAAVIIWGEEVAGKMVFNLLNLKQLDFEAQDLGFDFTKQAQIIAPDTYFSFSNADLSSQLSFLALFALGQTQYLNGDYEKAADLIKQGLVTLAKDSEPQGMGDVYFQLAWLYQISQANKGDFEQILGYYADSMRFKPEWAMAYNNRGALYAEQADYTAALADYNKAIDFDSQLAVAYYNRGLLYANQHDYTAAIGEYDEAIRFNSQFAAAYTNRGNAYANQEKPAAALADYDKAIDLEPRYAEAYGNRGNVYTTLVNFEAALADYNQVINLNPQDAKAYYNRGVMYGKQGNFEAAIADYDQAIRLKPNYAEAYGNRGFAHKAQDNLTATRQDWEKALELFSNPQDKENVQELLDRLEDN